MRFGMQRHSKKHTRFGVQQTFYEKDETRSATILKKRKPFGVQTNSKKHTVIRSATKFADRARDSECNEIHRKNDEIWHATKFTETGSALESKAIQNKQ